MKGKPFVRFGFFGLAALLVCALLIDCGFPFALAGATACLCAATLLVFLGNKHSKLYMTLFAVGLLLIGFFVRQHFVYMPALALDAQTVKVSGLVSDAPKRAGNAISFTLSTDLVEAEGAPQKLKIRIVTSAEVSENDRFTATVKLKKIDASDGSLRSYYFSKNIFLTGSAFSGCEIIPQDAPKFSVFMSGIRNEISIRINSLFQDGQAAAISKALLLGERNGIDDESYNEVKTAGAAHLLAVSGLHTSILAAALMLLLKLVRIPTRVCAVICSLFLLFYMALLRFSPTVTRAAIMAIITYMGIAFIRGSDPLHALGLAITAMLAVSPFSAIDAGFLLSVSATAGIILVSEKMKPGLQNLTASLPKLIKRPAYNLLTALCVSIAASVFVLPICTICFERVSLLSVPSALLLTPVVTLLLPCSAAAVIFCPLGIVGKAFAAVTDLLSKLFFGYTEWAAALPFASISTADAFISAGLCLALVGLMIALLTGGLRKHLYVYLLGAALVMTISFGAQGLYSHRLTEVSVYSDSTASCVLIKSGKKAILIGGGDRLYDLSQELDAQGVTLDCAILPAPQRYCSDAAQLELLFPDTPILCAPYADTELKNKTYIKNTRLLLYNYGVIDIELADEGFYIDVQTAEESILLIGGNPGPPILVYDRLVYLDSTCKNLPYSYNYMYAVADNEYADGDAAVMSDSGVLRFMLRADSVKVIREKQ